MAIEPSILSNPVPEVSVTSTQPATVTQTTSFAADAQFAGFIGPIETAAAKNPNAMLLATGAVIAYLAALFAILLVVSLTGNRPALDDVHAVFTGAPIVWGIFGAVLVGGAFLAQSPIKGK